MAGTLMPSWTATGVAWRAATACSATPTNAAGIMVQECVRLARDPQVFAEHPRACRVILDRIDEGRTARSARSLTIHSIV